MKETNTINMDIVTVEECEFMYTWQHKYSVISNGKLERFKEE